MCDSPLSSESHFESPKDLKMGSYHEHSCVCMYSVVFGKCFILTRIKFPDNKCILCISHYLHVAQHTYVRPKKIYPKNKVSTLTPLTSLPLRHTYSIHHTVIKGA